MADAPPLSNNYKPEDDLSRNPKDMAEPLTGALAEQQLASKAAMAGAIGGIAGGVLDIGMGLKMRKDGINALGTANQNLDDLKAAQPSLETPGAYYEQMKQAYDQRLMGMQVDNINRGLASTIDAASQYGARGLGAIAGASQAALEAQRKEVLTQQQLQTQALGELGAAQERSIGLKEQRSTRDIEYGYDAKVAAEAMKAQGGQQAAAGAMSAVGGVARLAIGGI